MQQTLLLAPATQSSTEHDISVKWQHPANYYGLNVKLMCHIPKKTECSKKFVASVLVE
jgi:hypothetical protein